MACRIAVHRKETGGYGYGNLKNRKSEKIYKTLSGEVRALDGVSLSVEEGEFAAIAGSSGSGKTTLLNMLGGLDYPTSGQVFIRGKALGEMNTEELTVFRRRNIALCSRPIIFFLS